jgi:hypothetical protein
MDTNGKNVILIHHLVRKASKAGWSVVKQGNSYPAQKCAGCGAPTGLTFEKNGKRVVRCFRNCSK